MRRRVQGSRSRGSGVSSWKMSWFDCIVALLGSVSAIAWGLWYYFDFNLVETITFGFKPFTFMVFTVIFLLPGLYGLWLFLKMILLKIEG